MNNNVNFLEKLSNNELIILEKKVLEYLESNTSRVTNFPMPQDELLETMAYEVFAVVPGDNTISALNAIQWPIMIMSEMSRRWKASI